MNGKRILPWLVAAAIASLLSGCSGDSDPVKSPGGGKTSQAKKTFKIAMIAKSQSNPVFQLSKTGAEEAAIELSKTLGVDIQIDWQTPANEDAQLQAQRIAQAANEGANCILLSCSDASKVKGAIDDAADKGVPVMTFDSDCAGSKRFAFYGVDDEDTGARVVQELANVANWNQDRQMNVAILAGNQTAPNLQKRVKGAKDEMAKHPFMKLVDVFYHVETPQDAAAKVLQVMKAHPEIDAWAMIGGWPLFTRTLLTELDPAKIKIVSVDCLSANLPYIELGLTPVLLAQPCYNWGYESVKLIAQKYIEKKDVPEFNKMDLVKVTKENLGDWARTLKKWGLTDVEQKYLDMK